MRATQIALLAVVIIVAAGFAMLADHLLRDVEAENYQATEEVMVDMAQILAAVVEEQVTDTGVIQTDALAAAMPRALERSFYAPIFDLAKSHVTASIYITDAAGKIIYDSEDPSRVGQDYSQKRDVLLTLRGLYGARSTRIIPEDSATSIMHVGAPIKHKDLIVGSLTVRKPKIDQWEFIEAKRRNVRLSLMLISVGIALFVSAVLFWVMQPLRKLTAYAQALQRGERTSLPYLRSSQEVQSLANAMEEMRTELEGRDYAGRYIQTLTHELKSPIAAIRATSELLAEPNMEPAQRQRFLQSLRNETERTEHLIRQLLRLAEVERMKVLQSRQPVDLALIVASGMAELAPSAEAKDLKWKTQVPPAAVLPGDEMLLRRAVLNLLENAIDFSPAGADIDVELQHLGTELRLRVMDAGPGVPDYAQSRLFERFYSLKHQATGRKGSGLGLCFVKETAELHGGSVTLSSREPNGTVAELVLSAENHRG
jgi:two-component system, OmpR family, sensor histidine kinase CreC